MSPCVVCSVTDIIAVPRRVSRPRASPRFGGEGRKGKLGRQVRRSFGRGLGGNALFLATDLTTGAEDLGGVGVLQGWAVSTDAAGRGPLACAIGGLRLLRSYVPAPGGSVRSQRAPKRCSDRAVQDGYHALGSSPALQTIHGAVGQPGAARGRNAFYPTPTATLDPAEIEGFGKVTRRWLAPLTQPRRLVMGDGGVHHARARAPSPPPGNGVYLRSDPPAPPAHAGCFFFCSRPARTAAGRASGMHVWK